MKKILLGLGSIAAVALPATIAISCEISDYDPDKIWEETVTFESTGNMDADFKSLQDQVSQKAIDLNKESGRRWEVHIVVNHHNPSGVIRTWTGTVASADFGRSRTAVNNDVNAKLYEYRDWAECKNGNYESEFFEESRTLAKQKFEQELEYARGLTHVSHIKITIWNHRGGIKAVYDKPSNALGSLDTIFDNIPNINSVYTPISQIGQP